jgi:hypothetical protein
MPAPMPFVLPVTREEIQGAGSWKGKGVCVNSVWLKKASRRQEPVNNASESQGLM